MAKDVLYQETVMESLVPGLEEWGVDSDDID